MGKDMGCRVGKGGHSQCEGPGAARRTGRRSSCQGTEGGSPGGPELRDLLKPEEAPKGSGQALSRGQRPPSWLHLAQAAVSQQPSPALGSCPAVPSPPHIAQRVILKRCLDSILHSGCAPGTAWQGPHLAGWLAAGSGHSTAPSDRCWRAAPVRVRVRLSLRWSSLCGQGLAGRDLGV